jgi:signal transduction histidine kinase
LFVWLAECTMTKKPPPREPLDDVAAAHQRQLELLAYELHDGLAQQLAAGLMHVDVAADVLLGNPSRAAAELDLASRDLRLAAAEVRRLIQSLRPLALDDGLVPAIERLATAARALVPSVEFACDVPSVRLDAVVENCLFRIAQEALSNACRHAAARRVTVELRLDHGHLRLTVRDDGRGFDWERATVGVGLDSMRQRAGLIGATFAVHSTPGRGTAVEIAWPWPA